MPSYQGQISEPDLLQIIAYIKSIGRNGGDDAMSQATIEPREEVEHYITSDYSLKSWLLTTDHKRIGLMYMVAITFFFFVGGAAATLIRLELMTPRGDLHPTARRLQPAVHPARHRDGLLLPDPGDPGRPGQLPAAADDRGARPGVPAG